ncbi:hypothetical protein SDC9_179444 [bioreactor metagenome]|uniref:Uncharacterized protein n=1 Tax=bioreactor metagenome TaxID=1076179 RepID=A0A645H1V2_9ZZZZ
MGGLFVEQALCHHAMIEQHIPVVAGKDNDGVIQKIAFPQGTDEQAYLVIDMGALRIERPERPSNVSL